MSAAANTSERRYYTEKQLQRAAAQIELWQEHLARTYRRELWDLAKTDNLAREALQREERFHGEHGIARTVIDQDLPRRRLWLHAALHILDFGKAELRIDFVLGDTATRERLIQWVIQRGGTYDRASGHRPPHFVEVL